MSSENAKSRQNNLLSPILNTYRRDEGWTAEYHICYNGPSGRGKTLDIVEVRGADALGPMRQEWDELVARCERATIYQTWEWNEAWWRAFRKNKRLRVIQARENGRLVGLAPLYVSLHLGTPLRRLAFIGTGAADYMDVITSDSRALEVCDQIVSYIKSARGYDLGDLQQLRPESVLRTMASQRPHDTCQELMAPQEPCPYVALPDDWEVYTKTLGKKMRTNISYYERLIGRTFEGAETRLATPDELSAGMNALFDLHQKRWNARLLPGVLGGKKVQMFHRTVAERFAAKGWLRLHITKIDGAIVAALYCFSFRGSYAYYLGGFAPELSKYSLGTVLTAQAMQQAICEGCAEFDFLRGNEPYKYRWQPQERINQRLLLARPYSVRSNAMLRLNRFECFVEHKAKAIAEKQGRGKNR